MAVFGSSATAFDARTKGRFPCFQNSSPKLDLHRPGYLAIEEA